MNSSSTLTMQQPTLPEWAIAGNIPAGKGHPLCRPLTFGNGVPWSFCTVCRGRAHNALCAIPKDYKIDCCKDRHDRLQAMGFTYGLDETHIPMAWD